MLSTHFRLCIYIYRQEGFLKLISSYDTKARFIPSVFISICPLQQVLKSIVESAFLFQLFTTGNGKRTGADMTGYAQR